MIGFNGTYLDKASLGNVRITAAAIGGQWVMAPWHIAPATQQAIIAAFGSEEGKAVISKTNDYLNAIAATDPERAQQLSAFINEDPMLVCSLVETSKTRWLVGDGKAWINTGIVPTATTGVKTKIKHKQSIYNSFVFSAGGLDDRYAMYEQNNVAIIWYVPNSYTSTNVKVDKTLVVEYNINNTVHIFDEQNSLLYSRALAQKDCTAPLRTGSSLSQYPTGVDDYSYIIMEDKGDCLQNLVPCQHQGQCGMLDIVSFTFHPNANTTGTFTIAITDKA